MNLEGVEKTMLLTLFAKARHSQEKNLEPPYPQRGQGFPDFNIME